MHYGNSRMGLTAQATCKVVRFMTTLRLDTLDDPRLDAYVRLTDCQLRSHLEPEQGILVVESRLAVEVALDEGIAPLSLLVDETRLAHNHDLVERMGEDCPVFVLGHEEMSGLTGYNVTRGLLCAMRRPRTREVPEVLADARNVAVLENLVDVTNVGAVFRSAAALGADAVLLSPKCADPLCRRAVRVSMGTVLQVPWARVDEREWPCGIVDDLHARGFSCLALALDDSAVTIDSPRLAGQGRRALFFGSEGYGLSEGALAACDRKVIIPMSNGVDSLNVAASSAVAFWELFSRGRKG